MAKIFGTWFLLMFLTVFAEEKRPNIIFIFADDIGYEVLQPYGGLDFKTPELDKMAKEGRLFKNMYTSPICTPSRVSMHTGLYSFRHQHYTVLPVHTGTKKKVDFDTMPTYAQLLKKNGYATYVTGKWQLATLMHHPDHIKNAGFDSWCVWQIWDDGNKTSRHWNPTINRDGKKLEGLEKKFGPDVFFEYVEEQMEKAVKTDKPFFILHNEILPHWPIVETPDDIAAKKEKSLEGMVSYMDKLVGKILKKVEQLGIRDNTYVFFMGDNGTWEQDFKNPHFGKEGELEHTRHTIQGKVNGGKGKLCDGGSHVPFLVWGPKEIPKNTTSDELIDVVDIFSTFCDLAKVKIPENIKTDGRSIAPQIHGNKGAAREWTHQGYKGESLFDGKYRYFLETGILWDATRLPDEMQLENNDETEKIRIRFKNLYENIKKNPPQAPIPLP